MKSSDFVSDIKKFDNRVKLFRFEKWSPWCTLCGLIRFIRAAPFYRPNFSTCSRIPDTYSQQQQRTANFSENRVAQ